MRLDPYVRDYRQFMDELLAALGSPETRLYLDTSVLMWLVRLGTTARSEFLCWCRNRPEGSVRVPVWGAHELHRHLTSRTVAKQIGSAVSEMERKLDDFVRLASERADEELCRANGYPSRAVFVAEVEQAFAQVKEIAKVVGSDRNLSDAADEVIKFVNERTLQSDINQILENLGRTGELRYSHLVPPGYHDKKAENKFGDVIVWEEILEDIQVGERSERRHGVLVSRDQKTDWVSSAPLVNAGKAPTKPNRDVGLDVTEAHPLLVHEFEARAGGGRLYVIPPSFLASALAYGSRNGQTESGYSTWLAAAHRPDLLSRLAAAELAPVAPVGSEQPTLAKEHESPVGTPPPSRESAYSYPSAEQLMKLSTTDEVNAYQAATPSGRTSLVQAWRSDLKSGKFGPERFGRVLAELSLQVQNSWLTRLPSIVEELRSDLSLPALNGLVLGATAPAYFDRYGEPLRRPHRDLGAVALLLERAPRFSAAFSTLGAFLQAADVELPYVPGKGRHKVPISVDATKGSGRFRTLREVRVGGESVLADRLSDDNPRRLETLLERERSVGCSGRELCTLLSREYLLPTELIDSDYDNQRFTWSPGAGLMSFDTSSPGGVSATASDEEDDIE